MVKALFDTNILVDYLNAVPEARTELQRYTEKAVSIITWMEVMVGADHAQHQGFPGRRSWCPRTLQAMKIAIEISNVESVCETRK